MSLVDPYLQKMTGPVTKASKASRSRSRAKKLLKLLAEKKNILVTTHQHPDPDALASSLAMTVLLTKKLPGAKISMSIKGPILGGINEMFVRQSNLKLAPWDDATLDQYDAIVLTDVQPLFSYSPLPPTVQATAVLDHHRSRGRHPHCAFCDIRTDVGATSSIIFSYFLELQVPIDRSLAALLLYAIESDLAGAAGTPGELDNVALSSLMLLADTHKFYQMRYTDLPQAYYTACYNGLGNAVYYDTALVSYLGEIDSIEKPAIIADFLLRFDPIRWAMLTAVYDGKLVVSLRTQDPKLSAADLMRHILSKIGEGGGHRSKAGGMIKLKDGSPKEIDRLRNLLKRRFLHRLGLTGSKPKPLIVKSDTPM
jgi:nanoRNase/pAp phosphatase (c-di-AMP/oligoRNAs hydrolase)